MRKLKDIDRNVYIYVSICLYILWFYFALTMQMDCRYFMSEISNVHLAKRPVGISINPLSRKMQELQERFC